MMPLINLSGVLRILCLGAHCNDLEMGAGGTIARLVEQHPKMTVCWVVFGGESPVRVKEARKSARTYLSGSGKKDVILHGFRDGFMPFQGEHIKECFDDLKSKFTPDLILTPHDLYRQPDHRLIAELTWSTWSDNSIIEYEVFEYCGDLGHPNFYVPLSEATCREKVSRLLNAFPSQTKQAWFAADALWSALRRRGVECNSPSRYAEGFYVRKFVANEEPARAA
jgi:LmbE family N-acetylglucosaminyl deacetylase